MKTTNAPKLVKSQPAILVHLTPTGDPENYVPASTEEAHQKIILRFVEKFLQRPGPGGGQLLKLRRAA